MAQSVEDNLIEQLHTMKRRMEVLFSESFKAARADPGTPEAAAQSAAWEPLMDIWETPDGWFLAADLPGVAEEDLQVEVAEKQLTVRGKRATSAEQETMKAITLERPTGAFRRSFTLPEDAREDSVKAELRHGVLTVAVPRSYGTQATSQRVQVRTG